MTALAFIDNYKAARARIEAQGRAFHERLNPLAQKPEQAAVVVPIRKNDRRLYNKPAGPVKEHHLYEFPIGPLISEPGLVVYLFGKKARVQSMMMRKALNDLLEDVAEFHGIKENWILSRRNEAEVMAARHAFMWIAYREVDVSLTDIGRLCRRDHTTVLHAVRKIDALLASGKITRAELGAPAEAGTE